MIDPAGTSADVVTLSPDGTFTASVRVSADDTRTGAYGVYVYPGSGAVDAAQEVFVPLSLAGEEPEPTPTPTPTPTPKVTPTPTPTVPGPSQVTGGLLTWGVKAAFRSYVTGPVAGGTVTPGQGATAAAGGAVAFPGATGEVDLTTSDIGAQYGGTVAFFGHGGALDLTLSHPRLVVGDEATLTVDVTTRPFQGPSAPPGAPVTTTDVPFADLTLGRPLFAAGVLTFSDVPATLTAEGAEAFGGFYAAGEALDPVTFSLALDGAQVPVPPTPPATPAPPASPLVLAVLDAQTARAGDVRTVTVPAGTFLAGEPVAVTAHSEPVALGTATAAADGSVSFTFAVPASLAVGPHTVVLVGQTSGAQASVPFTLLSAVASGALPATGAGLGILFGGSGLVLAGALMLLLARSREQSTV